MCCLSPDSFYPFQCGFLPADIALSSWSQVSERQYQAALYWPTPLTPIKSRKSSRLRFVRNPYSRCASSRIASCTNSFTLSLPHRAIERSIVYQCDINFISYPSAINYRNSGRGTGQRAVNIVYHIFKNLCKSNYFLSFIQLSHFLLQTASELYATLNTISYSHTTLVMTQK